MTLNMGGLVCELGGFLNPNRLWRRKGFEKRREGNCPSNKIAW